ncbi:angiotensin-converting enzyme-like [Bacillus rossius redtenbacheri]|uniref:angiotensin-converting enzyme-like n=1 Tax=Bacillus rossius redtenbacheri TaxID=93214 RepID=UPI002FDE1B1B
MLGLDAMTPTSWRAPSGRNTTCHGTAANMFRPGDYRMLLCAEVSAEDFYVIHHEMGHIEYYMSYRDQPAIFQDGANSAFQEAVGDAVMFGVLAPQHLLRLRLVDDDEAFSPDTQIALLLQQALARLPQVPFGLLVDKWRWRALSGALRPPEYTAAWWALRSHYQGVSPPVPRAADDFDPAAKFHIPDNTPYVRYFLASFLQMQLFKAMCEAAVLGRVGPPARLSLPLHQCDIYGSKDAGKRLRAMMEMGSSRPWPAALEAVAGERGYSAGPLLQYYAPLHDWLARQVWRHRIPVGWDRD